MSDGANVKMDNIDDLDSVVDGESFKRACIDTLEAKRTGVVKKGDKVEDYRGSTLARKVEMGFARSSPETVDQ